MTNRLMTSLVVLVLSTGAAMSNGKINIITSFPDSMTGPIEAAFEAANPQYDLEVLNKKTSAGVKFIQETSDNNTSDIFWASAPDARATAASALKSFIKILHLVRGCLLVKLGLTEETT